MKNDVKREPLWITRLKLWARSFKQNWALFKERKIAIFGLGVIVFFALYGALHGVYVNIMEKVYISKTYKIAQDVYGVYEKALLKDLEKAIENGDNMSYRLALMQKERDIDKEAAEIFKKHGMIEENEFYDNLKMLLTSKYFDYDSRASMVDNLKSILREAEITENNIESLTKKITSYFFFEKLSQFINEFGNEEKSSVVWKFVDEKKLKETLMESAKSFPDYIVEIAKGYNLNFDADFVKKHPEEVVNSIISMAKYNFTPVADIAYDAVKIDAIKKELETNEDFYIALFEEMKDILRELTSEKLDQEKAIKEKERFIQLMLENSDLDTLSTAYLISELKEAFSAGKNVDGLLKSIMKKHIKYNVLSDLRFDPSMKMQSYKNSFDYYDSSFYSIIGINEVVNKLDRALEENNKDQAIENAKELVEKLKNLKDTRKTAAIISNWVENLKGGNAGYQKMGLDFRSVDQQLAPNLKNEIDATFESLGSIARDMTDYLNTMEESYINSIYRKAREILKDLKDGKSVSAGEFRSYIKSLPAKKDLLEEDAYIYKMLKDKEEGLRKIGKKIIIQDVYYLANFFAEKLKETLGDVDVASEMQNAAQKYLEILKGNEDFDLEKELKNFSQLVAKAQQRILSMPTESIKLPEYNLSAINTLVKYHDDFQKKVKEVLKSYVGNKAGKDLVEALIKVAVDFDLQETASAFYFSSLPYDPITGNDGLFSNPAPPSALHPLGTDPLGRDIMSEMMYSTPREFVLGVTAALITVVIGTLIGATAAYYGGAIDTFFMRLADIVMLFPSLALLMVLSAFMELTLFRLALIMGIISGFGSITIVLKAQALTVKVRPFIEAARSAGGSNFYIISKHIIPNILPLSFLYMMFSVTGAIFSEAVLSFFGLVQLKMSWGIILHTAQSQGYLIGTNIGTFWWLWVPPGAAITLICSAFYFLGRGLEEIVNPRLRSR